MFISPLLFVSPEIALKPPISPLVVQNSGKEDHILGDPGGVSRVDKMFVVKVYCKIETLVSILR